MADYTVIEIADPKIVAAQESMAAAQTAYANSLNVTTTAAATSATANTNIATAQASIAQSAATNLQYNANMSQAHGNIAMSANRLAAAFEESEAEANKPHLDHQVWLSAAAARATHPDRVVSSWPEVAVFADKILAAYKQRFPRV